MRAVCDNIAPMSRRAADKGRMPLSSDVTSVPVICDVRLSVCLSGVCLSCTSDLSREQRGIRKTKIGTEVSNVTRDSDTTFKVKRSRSQGGGGILWRPPAQRVAGHIDICCILYTLAAETESIPVIGNATITHMHVVVTVEG